ncbi:molecular chaperone [Stenotrophomonas maltophilia]|uniref:fimbrial biogenesis chaperone n=1 Tax=Stenotrophomonas maltophilia TaxID=40324 RepID=UPI0015DF22F9|nr:molecular chaperone [Stenotrophomonas maltophilia]MBA0387062.1 molecular chaperone [Stenotrophomonas maltophilia]MBA0390160.1 molecular chaperone [Stenotrophomonas maltophilia]MBA0463689.1 molecular chaperone [Stenotrophomonas maltophilia]MBA0471203.1 molecular chaperone [Stenotrophomonas maltophilia]
MSRRLAACGMTVARVLVACLLLISVGDAAAQVALPSTRVVIRAEQGAVTVPLHNMGEVPVLVQAWIAEGDPNQPPEQSAAPFAMAPPLMRLDPGKDKPLRIRTLAARAPTDGREHLYWLNVHTISSRPEQAQGDRLELPVRSIYKLLYRPAGLSAPTAKRAEVVTVQLRGQGTARSLIVANPTPYYLNLGDVTLLHASGDTRLGNPHVAPFGSVAISIPDDAPDGRLSARLNWIDDDGRLLPIVRELDHGPAVDPRAGVN